MLSETRWLAGRMSKLSLRSGRKKFQPRCRCRIRLCALYWVATQMRRMPELMALDRAKSMMRDLPPKNTAGLARRSVSSMRRLPRPPARTKAMAERERLPKPRSSRVIDGSSCWMDEHVEEDHRPAKGNLPRL